MISRATWGRSQDAVRLHQNHRYELVRYERLVVGPTTMPYPINHETVLMTSDSVAELTSLRDKITGANGGSAIAALQPDNWIDAIPGEKAFSYDVRRA